MKRIVTAGLLGLAAVGGLFAVAGASPAMQNVVAPLTAEQQRDWDCLDAVVQGWSLHPTQAHTAAASAEVMKEMRTYYLGRLSAELGDERLRRYLHETQTQPARSARWTDGSFALCRLRMERSAEALKPMESRNFSLQDAASSH